MLHRHALLVPFHRRGAGRDGRRRHLAGGGVPAVPAVQREHQRQQPPSAAEALLLGSGHVGTAGRAAHRGALLVPAPRLHPIHAAHRAGGDQQVQRRAAQGRSPRALQCPRRAQVLRRSRRSVRSADRALRGAHLGGSAGGRAGAPELPESRGPHRVAQTVHGRQAQGAGRAGREEPRGRADLLRLRAHRDAGGDGHGVPRGGGGSGHSRVAPRTGPQHGQGLRHGHGGRGDRSLERARRVHRGGLRGEQRGAGGEAAAGAVPGAGLGPAPRRWLRRPRGGGVHAAVGVE
mmetsp:Transcript_12940/g.47953  ORF Transcript_12940/g.47953 Transcript_12940/m.47953 type:complete len:290 (-) Transcript_12940:428-1297(-)